MAATPIDFDQLIADGVLRKHGARYEVLDPAPTRAREAENTPWHDFSQDEQPRGFVHKAKQANVSASEKDWVIAAGLAGCLQGVLTGGTGSEPRFRRVTFHKRAGNNKESHLANLASVSTLTSMSRCPGFVVCSPTNGQRLLVRR